MIEREVLEIGAEVTPAIGAGTASVETEDRIASAQLVIVDS